MNEQGYIDLLQRILDTGVQRDDRTGTGTLALFGHQLRFDLMGGTLPVLTTKRVAWKTCLKELLWFLRGSTDANELAAQGVHIWDGNTTREFLDKRGLMRLPEGDVGATYGFQWRHFGADYTDCTADYKGKGVDQLSYVVDLLKNDPFSRRIFMSAWNPAALDTMALPPCHVSAQFFVHVGKDGVKHLSCHLYQRSADCFLGLPFNIMSYAALTHLLAKKVGDGMVAHELIISTGDTHLYLDHVEQAKIQIQRKLRPFPTVTIDDAVTAKDWGEITLDDFHMKGYDPHPAIQATMSV